MVQVLNSAIKGSKRKGSSPCEVLVVVEMNSKIQQSRSYIGRHLINKFLYVQIKWLGVFAYANIEFLAV